MGTNYYAEFGNRIYPYKANRIHIGKSSSGWAFALHLDLTKGLGTFLEWRNFYSQPQIIIRTDAGETIHPKEMTQIITARDYRNYKMDPEMLGPLKAWYDVEHGLLRAVCGKSTNLMGDPVCIASDPQVTFDVFVGDFS